MYLFIIKVTKIDDCTFRIYSNYKDCRISDAELMDLSNEIWRKSVYTSFLDSQYKDMGILILHNNYALWRDSLTTYGDLLQLVAERLHSCAKSDMYLSLELPEQKRETLEYFKRKNK